MGSFGKNEGCPASAELLAFQDGDVSPSDGLRIRTHLKICEFCAAEAEFYSRFPPVDDMVEIQEIPQPLRELAEALLTNRQKKSKLLDDLLG